MNEGFIGRLESLEAAKKKQAIEIDDDNIFDAETRTQTQSF